MPIYLRKSLIVELPLTQNDGIITVLPFSKCASPIFAQRKANGNYVSLWTSENPTPWLQMIILSIITQWTLCLFQHNTWQANLYSASSIAPRLINVCRWRTNVQWKCLHSISPAEFWLLETCARSWQIWICVFERVFRPSCQGWPMCSMQGWKSNCSEKCYGSYPDYSSSLCIRSLQVYSPIRIENGNWKMPPWSQTYRIPT